MRCYVSVGVSHPFDSTGRDTMIKHMKEAMPCSPDFVCEDMDDYDAGCIGIRFYSGKCDSRIMDAIDFAYNKIPIFSRPKYVNGSSFCIPIRWSRPKESFSRFVAQDKWVLTSGLVHDFERMELNKELDCYFYR